MDELLAKSPEERGVPTVLPGAPVGSIFQFDLLFWNLLSAMQLIRRFPFVLQLDPTGSTNRDRLPFLHHVGADGDNKTAYWGASVLGSGELQTNFEWELDVSMYHLYGALLTQVCVTSTDGDPAIYGPVQNAIDQGRLGGKRARCYYHLVDQKFTNEINPGMHTAHVYTPTPDISLLNIYM